MLFGGCAGPPMCLHADEGPFLPVHTRYRTWQHNRSLGRIQSVCQAPVFGEGEAASQMFLGAAEDD